MSQVSFSGAVISALDCFNEDFANSRASTGGPQRPPTGEWDNIVDDIIIETDDVKFNVDKENEIPGFSVLFKYRVLGGTSAIPPEMKAGQEWPGRSFVLPAAGLKGLPSNCSKGKRQNVEISLQRLKGHLQTFLGDSFNPNNLSASLQAAVAKVRNKDSGVVAVRVRCKVDKPEGSDTTYFEEFLQRRLA